MLRNMSQSTVCKMCQCLQSNSGHHERNQNSYEMCVKVKNVINSAQLIVICLSLFLMWCLIYVCIIIRKQVFNKSSSVVNVIFFSKFDSDYSTDVNYELFMSGIFYWIWHNGSVVIEVGAFKDVFMQFESVI